MALRRQDSFPRPGQRWAHLEIAGEVARGNMGVVFRARDLEGGRDLALKVLVVGHDDRESCERFKREARSLARLSHRHIVSVHSYGVHEGIPFLTMDFVPGTTLQELLDRGALTLNRAVDLLARIAHAMDHAHSRGVLHRDLKPANVLIGADGAPRITDFGLARLDDASASFTRDGDLIGTPVYMAPEQIRGDLRAMGPSADVWALGVMLYVVLTGALPFPGASVDEVSRRVTGEEPPPPRQARPHVPEDLERVCLVALRKDPRARYQSAGELARDLEAYLRGRPVLAGAVTLGVRARRVVRAARLNAGAVGALLAILVLAGGLAVGRHMDASSRVERSATELLLRAVQRRAAAQVAVDHAAAAWERGDSARVSEQARHALDEVAWAAAYLERAARTDADDDARGLRLDEALGASPEPAEAALGLMRDPVLARLHGRGRSLQARVAGGVAAAGAAAWTALVDGFRLGGDLADLEALAAAAERTGALAPARLARAALDARGLQPGAWSTAGQTDARDLAQEARLMRLLARLAAQGAAASCAVCPTSQDASPAWVCPVCDHGCVAPAAGPCPSCGVDASLGGRDDAPGAAAREALARAALRRGDAAAASAALRPTDAPLLRAEVARALGRRAEHEAALGPLLAAPPAAQATSTRGQAWLERARGLLAAGFPRAAQEAAKVARTAAPLDGPLLADARAVDGAAQAAMGEPALALRALARDEAAPLLTRLEALRLLALAGDEDLLGDEPRALTPGSTLDDGLDSRLDSRLVPTLPHVRARTRLRLARAAGAVSRALGRLALRAQGLERLAAVDERQTLDLDALEADARSLGAAQALAGVAVLRLASGSAPGRGLTLARAARVCAPDAQAALVALRLAGEPRDGAPADLEPPSAALLEGRAWLGAPAVDSAARLRAGRALELAVRLAPFSAGPYVARATLRLRAAGEAPDEPARRSLVAAALRDAAAATAVEPDAPTARAALLLALAVVAPDEVAHLLQRPGPPLARGERRTLERATDLPSHAGSDAMAWTAPRDPDDQVALRLATMILAARGQRPPASADTVRVADALRRRLDDAPSAGLEPDLLHAALLLEDPTELDAWLLHRRWTASDAELAAAVDGERAAEARVALIIDELTRIPPGAAPAALARARTRGLALLEGVARHRPGPTVSALRAAIEVWTGTPALELSDLLAHAWTGSLRDVLRAAAGEAGAGRDGLWAHPAVRRLLTN